VLELVLQLMQAIQIGSRARGAMGQCVVLDQHLLQLAEAGGHGLKHGVLRLELRFLRHESDAQTRRAPDDALVEHLWPARTLRRLVLPVPLRPISATRSPLSSAKSAWSSSGASPKASDAWSSVMRGMQG
jgi:hypothetical protein